MSNISDLVAVATFRSTADALIAKGLLDESGLNRWFDRITLAGCIRPRRS